MESVQTGMKILLLGFCEDSSDYIFLGSSSECLSGKYCNCSLAIKFNNSIGCVSVFQDLSTNSDGETCLYSNCYGGIISDCKCASQSCIINAKTECQCLSSADKINDNCHKSLLVIFGGQFKLQHQILKMMPLQIIICFLLLNLL